MRLRLFVTAAIVVAVTLIALSALFLQYSGDVNDTAVPAVDDAALDFAFDGAVNATTLIIVAGHAVLNRLSGANVSSPSSWFLFSYQSAQLPTFLAHIRRGVEALSADPSALLVFSGGATRRTALALTEAASYYVCAQSLGIIGDDNTKRVALEEAARDSYENLVFSICRFYEMTAAYPRRIVVVGFDFKRRRFTDLHRAAIRFPLERFEYIGIDTPNMSDEERGAVERGEEEKSRKPFAADAFGCAAELSAKRMSRNPFRRSVPYGHSAQSCPHMKTLLHACAGADTSGYPLPWEE